MRTDLIVDYKEKDKVKALGAKWDKVRKVWYVEDVENMEPFLPWIPSHLKKPCRPVSFKKQLKGLESKMKLKKKKD